MKHTNIAIFASGGGSNALKIIQYFRHHHKIKVALIVSNQAQAGVIQVAISNDLPVEVVQKSLFSNEVEMLALLKKYKVDFIVLAGFLWLIPPFLVSAFKSKILNIHPSLLPLYGGKGMYGQHVHQAVKKDEKTETGMTIHLVNEKYDDGDILLQKKCTIEKELDAAGIAKKVLELEHLHYSPMIEQYICSFE